MFTTPILLLTFNRPDYVEQQLRLLNMIRPTTLYVACDGPRERNKTDIRASREIRDLVEKKGWKCETHMLFRKKNLGCRVAVSSAIDWFFTHEKEGIIIEDDCIADPSFFTFCHEMLSRYRNTEKVMHIGGMLPVLLTNRKTSYAFSVHPLCWGWATWRRAWKKYDVNMKTWPHRSHSYAKDRYWSPIFQKMYEKKIDTWDYQWVYTLFESRGLSVVPTVNLVRNIGFDSRATHTKFIVSPLSHLIPNSIHFPLRHPSKIQTDTSLDNKIQSYFELSFIHKIWIGLKRYFL